MKNSFSRLSCDLEKKFDSNLNFENMPLNKGKVDNKYRDLRKNVHVQTSISLGFNEENNTFPMSITMCNKNTYV